MAQNLSLSPDDWKDYYGYPSDSPSPRIDRLKRSRRYTVKNIALIFPGENGAGENFHLTVFEPHTEGRLPTVLVNPIFRGLRVARIFARYFAKKGFMAVVIHHEPFAYDAEKNLDQIENYLRKAVIRNLKTLDWIAGYERTDPDRIGTFGISFGAIIGSVVAALDTRPKCHVIALAGAPIADVLSKTRNRLMSRLMRREARRREKSRQDLALDMLRHIKTEPLLFAKHVKRENIAMYISLFDRVVKPSCARRLWRAMGKPKAFFVPFGHYTSILSFPYAERLATRFFREKLSPAL